MLALPDGKGKFYLDTDASEVAIAGLLHQAKDWNGRKVLRPICYGSKVLNEAQAIHPNVYLANEGIRIRLTPGESPSVNYLE